MRSTLALTLSLVSAGCGNDDGGPVLPGPSGPCLDGYPAIHRLASSSRCASAGCHVGPSAATSGNLDLSGDEATVYARLVGVATADPEAVAVYPFRVEAGSSTTSYFLHIVEATTPVGSLLGRMPPGGALDPCEIESIRDWIEAGAPER